MEIRKWKIAFFLTFVYLFWIKFLTICVLSHCIVYWINLQNIYTFTYQKILLLKPLFLVSKIVASFQCILKFFKKSLHSSFAMGPNKGLFVILELTLYFPWKHLRWYTFSANSISWSFKMTIKLVIIFFKKKRKIPSIRNKWFVGFFSIWSLASLIAINQPSWVWYSR